MDCFNDRMFAMSVFTLATLAFNSRMDFEPFCRKRPFADDIALPSDVLGPVDLSQGFACLIDARSFARAASLNGPRFDRFLFPAATRRGLGDELSVLDMLESLIICLTN